MSYVCISRTFSFKPKKMKTKLEKHVVCKHCQCVGIGYSECRCTYMNNYPTIELEFEVCNCCGNLVQDGCPADTEFNKQQFEKEKNNKEGSKA